MKIFHRFSIGQKEAGIYAEKLHEWGVVNKIVTRDRGRGVRITLYIMFDEEHPKTEDILKLRKNWDEQDFGGVHGWWVDFTEEEILAEPWAEMTMMHESYYPQPTTKMEWKKQVYENVCPAKWCGVGFHQKAPFRFAREFRMGRYHLGATLKL